MFEFNDDVSRTGLTAVLYFCGLNTVDQLIFIEMENLEDEPGLTVTICLDEEGTKDSSNVSEEDIFGHIEQPSASKFVVPINPEIRISQLPAPIIRILGLRLNPPSIGTMRNWEYLAAILG